MTATKMQKVLIAFACCFALVLIPLSAGAQNILQKGAQGVQKGVETGAEKTKEGAQAVGHGVKKAVTGDDTTTTTTTREKTSQQPTTSPSTSTTTGAKSTTTTEKSTTSQSKSGSTEKTHAGKSGNLPRTAGELPLLALIGSLALAASGTMKLVRRSK